ncbi:MAG: FAD binding domain-containing protein [Phenylobacterium sp.]|uniref:FAD binding domain-containing protein n=1 Tax=Phenylobacterium sp. TaxID=1871053 RepID=UPI00273670D8|nr:FAD binding domain-containing protein [Phenylobacterium sp.]MDP3749603.1 FAD binding domain-containing protein [Phenylobacterium sp.]
MIPVDFDYVRPTDLAVAGAILVEAAPGAVAVLAGGQSLMTELKLRTRRPQLVLDIGGIDALRTIEQVGDTLRIGAMVSQADLARHPVVQDRLPMLIEVAAVAADPMVRRRGTLLGAICQADPTGDWVAACLVLDAVVELRRGDVLREVAMQDFVTGARETGLQPGEIATALRIALPVTGAGSAYRKVRHTAIGWSIAGLAAMVEIDPSGRCADCRLAASGALTHPQRLTALEDRLRGLALHDTPTLAQVIGAAMSDLVFQDDRHASAEHRGVRLSVLLQRTLADLAG